MSRGKRCFSIWRCLLLFAAVIGAAFVFAMVAGGIETSRRMDEIRSRVSPGMTVHSLHSFLGRPMEVFRPGGPPVRGVPTHSSYIPPVLAPGTAIHFYAESGIPYYNTYVLVDESSERILQCDVVNAMW